MAFEFTDQHVKDYHELGFTIFRSLLPPALIRDLRVQAEVGRSLARKRSGEQAQRLQPVASCPEIDMRPFDDYHSLPALNDALTRLFEEGFGDKPDAHATRGAFAILYEPALSPWCTQWHRDWRDNMRGLRLAEWDKVMLDIRMFNQVNCALYDDSCTWVVPGSHLRRDTEGEVLRFPERPIAGPDLQNLGGEEAERVCLEYTRSMPGGVQAHLNAGDYMLYRNTLWHTGNYVPYRKRATIHDGIFTPLFKAFFEHPPIHPRQSDGSTLDWENPNLHTAAYRRWKQGAGRAG